MDEQHHGTGEFMFCDSDNDIHPSNAKQISRDNLQYP